VTPSIIAIGSLWLAAIIVSYLVIQTADRDKMRQHRIALIALSATLLIVPAGGVLSVGLRHKARLLALFTTSRSPAIGLPPGCSLFPRDNIWNTPVRDLPPDPNSLAYVNSIGTQLSLHADFSTPYNVVTTDGPMATVSLEDGGPESDPGPYRVPDDAVVEPGEDAHLLVVDSNACRLYELFAVKRTGPHGWQAGSGAIFDLRSNRLRPAGWTSADGAGLPIVPGLVRYEEVQSGAIRHALRFTAKATRREFVWPARHFASYSTDSSLPPMGQRFRLRSSFDVTGFGSDAQVILTALKEYGMMLADNGGSWFLTGAPDSRWSSRTVSELRRVSGADFEAVNVSGVMSNVDSGKAGR
jgi:hypothetical protein